MMPRFEAIPCSHVVERGANGTDGVFVYMCENEMRGGGPSIARQKLVRAGETQCSICSERMLMEQKSYVQFPGISVRRFIAIALALHLRDCSKK